MELSEIRKAPFYYPDFGGEMVRDPILTTKVGGGATFLWEKDADDDIVYVENYCIGGYKYAKTECYCI